MKSYLNDAIANALLFDEKVIKNGNEGEFGRMPILTKVIKDIAKWVNLSTLVMKMKTTMMFMLKDIAKWVNQDFEWRKQQWCLCAIKCKSFATCTYNFSSSTWWISKKDNFATFIQKLQKFYFKFAFRSRCIKKRIFFTNLFLVNDWH